MEINKTSLTPSVLFSLSPIVPVIVINDLTTVIPLANALLAGGISILEVTLRTELALEAIHIISQEMPHAIVGAGTVIKPAQIEQCIKAGAAFTISPGFTQDLLQAGVDAGIPFIPGISSVSELMEGASLGYEHFKFFPAEPAGGVSMLKAMYGPLPSFRFCPTGGINEKNFLDYLSLPNVECVGGSWILPDSFIKQGYWDKITELCLNTVSRAREIVTSQ